MESKKWLKTKEVLSEFFKLLLSIKNNDLNVLEYLFDNHFYDRISSLICEIYLLTQFDSLESMYLLNLLINMATDLNYYEILEKYLFKNINKNDLQINIINNLIYELETIYNDVIKYIIIKNPHYLEIVFTILYELNLDEKIRYFYFSFLNELVANSNYNAQILVNEILIEKIGIMIRIETDYNLKCVLANLAGHLLNDHMSINRLKGLIKTLRYNYYWNDVLKFFIKLNQEKIKTNFFDQDNYYHSLKFIFQVLQKIVERYLFLLLIF